MKLIVENTEVKRRAGTSSAGVPWEIFQQAARVMGEVLAGPIEIILDGSDTAYAVGEYEIDFERSLQFGRFGRLEMRNQLVVAAGKKGQVMGMDRKAG